MAVFKLSTEGIEPLVPTTFEAEGLRERGGLQARLRDSPEILERGLFILAEEFSNWEDSGRRIDLLALDSDGKLVVIELKRTEDGGHMELQALRYAAMVANMTLDEAVDAHAKYLRRRGLEGDARQRIIDHLASSGSEEQLDSLRPRILLVSAGFRNELTTSVLWLNELDDIDIKCIRIKPYKLAETVVVEIEQIIPLPEASHYLVKVRQKVEEAREASSKDLRRFNVEVMGQLHERLAKRRAALEVVRAAICDSGVSPGTILDETTEGRKRRRSRPILVSFDGRLSQPEFLAHLEEEMPAYVRRYFTDKSELMYHDGRTWAFTNQWGLETETFIRELSDQHPELHVKLSVFEDT